MSFRSFMGTLFVLTALVLATFATLRYLHVPAGDLADWLIGVGILWWFAVVTTLPWNAHFAALAVVEEADTARRRGVVVDEAQVAFARRVAARFRLLAIALHLLTAAVLLVLAWQHRLALGYPAAGAALLLTFARPAERAWEHLRERLSLMRQQVSYPHEDVVELRERLRQLETDLERINQSLDVDTKGTWAAELVRQQAQNDRRLDRLDSLLEGLTRANAREHEALARQTTQEIARLSEDARFLNQVRELIRFVKQA